MDNKLFSPSPDILEAIEDSYTLFQLLNQKTLGKFEEYLRTSRYTINLGEYSKMKTFQEVSEHQGKPWEYIIKTKFLIEHDIKEVNTNIFVAIPDEYLPELSMIIKKGTIGLQKIKDWIKNAPREALFAMYDACKVSIGSGEDYKQLDILEIANITTSSDSKFTLYNEIFEIKSPEEMIMTLQLSREPVKNGILLSILKDKERFYKSTFYIFLAFNNKLYSISNHEHRLNLDNIEGDRDPDRYMEYKYENTWLPAFLLYDNWKSTKKANVQITPDTTSLELYNIEPDRIISTWETVVSYYPGCYYWINMLTIRLFNILESMNITRGLLPNNALKLLRAANDRNDMRFETKYKQGKGAYLLNVLSSQTSSIVIHEESLPLMISTQEHIEKLIAYKRRQKLAEEFKQKLHDNYEEKHETVYKKIATIIKRKGIENIILRALEDKAYPFEYYRAFSNGLIPNHWEVNDIAYEKVMKITEETRHSTLSDSPACLLVPYDPNDEKYRRVYYHCALCTNFQRKLYIQLTFHEWTQIVNFFNIPKEKFPREMIDHLHQQNEMYVGNTNLDDLDPIDMIRDPWFRTGHNTEPSFIVSIPLCSGCYRKMKNKFDKINEIKRNVFLSLYDKESGMTMQEISKITRISENTLPQYLSSLHEQGALLKKEEGKQTFWLPTKAYQYLQTEERKMYKLKEHTIRQVK
jgi:L-rhamnose mutarotase